MAGAGKWIVALKREARFRRANVSLRYSNSIGKRPLPFFATDSKGHGVRIRWKEKLPVATVQVWTVGKRLIVA